MCQVGPMRSAILLPFLFSCALSHQVQGDARVDAGDPGVDVCIPPAPLRVPIALGEVSSATFVGEYLHLEAEFDGVRRYAIAEVRGQDLSVTSFAPLAGPANWVPADAVGVEHYARGRATETELLVEVLDARSASAPLIVDTLTVPITRAPQWERFFSVDGDHFISVCRALPWWGSSAWFRFHRCAWRGSPSRAPA